MKLMAKSDGHFAGAAMNNNGFKERKLALRITHMSFNNANICERIFISSFEKELRDNYVSV